MDRPDVPSDPVPESAALRCSLWLHPESDALDDQDGVAVVAVAAVAGAAAVVVVAVAVVVVVAAVAVLAVAAVVVVLAVVPNFYRSCIHSSHQCS